MTSKYNKISSLSSSKFRRLTGINRNTFSRMVLILKEHEHNRKKKPGGGLPCLSTEDSLLMWLEYLREYRTYFHVAASYNIHESSCYRYCRKIENVLIKSGVFSLPGKKALLQADNNYQTILIDATESPIERPKKSVK